MKGGRHGPGAFGGPTWAGAALALQFALGCEHFPADPEETSERVASEQVIRVGITEHAPWTRRGAREPGGYEVELVQTFANERGARIAWRWGQQEALLRALEHYQLDLVIGGIDEDTPWKEHLALTEPWFERGDTALVLALPPGENRWLGAISRHLAQAAPALALRAHAEVAP